ncbi:hypothetical protein GCM10022384_23590 [Streptomyces marokkonensis]|uniref:Transposase n=1 Tax=Streptomyces marokkonensis TaxID=324855 RepID=A0ABP7PVL8_9ACTN
MLVRIRLALRLDGEHETALLTGHMHPEHTVHSTLKWPDLGEIGIQGLDRGVLRETNARPRQKPAEQPRIRPEDPVQRFVR